MMTGRHGKRLGTWIAAARADDLPHLHTFANGLERDHAAVLNGLTLPYSSGAVEGNVCRVKAIKRSRYGRAKTRPPPKDHSLRGIDQHHHP
jgi:transposase